MPDQVQEPVDKIDDATVATIASTSQITALNRMNDNILRAFCRERIPSRKRLICRASPWRMALREWQPAEDMQDEPLLERRNNDRRQSHESGDAHEPNGVRHRGGELTL